MSKINKSQAPNIDSDHECLNWKIYEIANDFKLLDTWKLPIEVDLSKDIDLERVLDIIFQHHSNKDISDYITDFLFKLRKLLGNVFGWDKEQNTLPIPGCKEISLRERLQQYNIPLTADSEMDFRDDNLVKFRSVYSLPYEKLMELSNNTVHGLMHYALVRKNGSIFIPQLSVYVKTRGFLGRFYISLIMPFRHLFVYPTLIKNVKRNWDVYCRKEKLNE